MSDLPKLQLQPYVEESLSKDYAQRRLQLIDLARLAESSERFEDMCKIVKVWI